MEEIKAVDRYLKGSTRLTNVYSPDVIERLQYTQA
jgi:hypothetical protein